MMISPLGWACVSNPCEVTPFNDIAAHITGANCPCGPEVDEDDIIIHNAWDEREAYIEGRRKPS